MKKKSWIKRLILASFYTFLICTVLGIIPYLIWDRDLDFHLGSFQIKFWNFHFLISKLFLIYYLLIMITGIPTVYKGMKEREKCLKV